VELAIQKLTRGLHAGDLEAILLTVLIAADENRMVCGAAAKDRILTFLKRLRKYDDILPHG
jgi:hypothetical protein